jgi:hypothetical protein
MESHSVLLGPALSLPALVTRCPSLAGVLCPAT